MYIHLILWIKITSVYVIILIMTTLPTQPTPFQDPCEMKKKCRVNSASPPQIIFPQVILSYTEQHKIWGIQI